METLIAHWKHCKIMVFGFLVFLFHIFNVGRMAIAFDAGSWDRGRRWCHFGLLSPRSSFRISWQPGSRSRNRTRKTWDSLSRPIGGTTRTFVRWWGGICWDKKCTADRPLGRCWCSRRPPRPRRLHPDPCCCCGHSGRRCGASKASSHKPSPSSLMTSCPCLCRTRDSSRCCPLRTSPAFSSCRTYWSLDGVCAVGV